MSERFYTSALAFASDLCTVLRKGIQAAPAIQSAPVKEEAIRDLDSLAKQDKLDIKERQKFARKIIKAVRPQLEAAVQAEADLSNKAPDVLLKELELLFESSLETRTDSINGSTSTGDALATTAVAPSDINGSANTIDPTAGGENAVKVEMANGQENPEEQAPPANETTAENGDNATTNPAQDTEQEQLKSSTLTNGDTPPSINGYVSAPEHIHPSPPTPPLSNGDGTNPDNNTAQNTTQPTTAQNTTAQNTTQNDPLAAGGIPWYLEGFKPEGTIISEEQWSGRDIVRSMSEELSEIDDEELKGLMGPDAMDLDVDGGGGGDGVGAQAGGSGGAAAATPKTTKKGKKKKAWRGFK